MYTKNLPTFQGGRETTHKFSKINNLKKEEGVSFPLFSVGRIKFYF